MNLLKEIEQEQVAKLTANKEIPEFQPGDTVIVNVKIVEGERTRVQAYEGVCIGRAGGGLNQNFTVRKISYGEGVERVFPLYSPMIDSIKVVRRGQVRRAKLYYLRGLRGKSARIAERQDHSAQSEAAEAEGGGVIIVIARSAATKQSRVRGSDFGLLRFARNDDRRDEHCPVSNDGQTSHPLRQDLDRPPRRRAAGRHLPHLYRPASGARGDEPAGVRGLRLAGRKVHAPEKTLCVVDHNVPTTDRTSRIPIRRARRRSPISPRTPSCSGSNISTSSTSARASSTSSGRSRASRCPAPRSSAATATPPPTARSARSPTASARRKSSMCWRRRR